MRNAAGYTGAFLLTAGSFRWERAVQESSYDGKTSVRSSVKEAPLPSVHTRNSFVLRHSVSDIAEHTGNHSLSFLLTVPESAVSLVSVVPDRSVTHHFPKR